MTKNKIFGLIGYPLGHSFSRKFFNQKFKEENINAEYRNFEISDIQEFKNILDKDIAGLNITIPYKEKIMPLLAEIDETARQIGSVNVVKVTMLKNGIHTKGFNTDVIGFSDSIRPYLKPVHKNALVLGTGGASKAVVYALRQLDVSPTLVSRSNKNGSLTYAELTQELIQSAKVIVNTTPLGMFPNTEQCPDIPYDALGKDHICFDLIYNPAKTLFLKKAAKQKATAINGMEMLVRQALAAWNIWNE